MTEQVSGFVRQKSSEGTFILSNDCTLDAELTTTGDLEIVGQTQDMDNLVTITAASNKRHITLNNPHSLTLRYLELTGGKRTDAGQVYGMGGSGGSISHESTSSDTSLYIYSCIFRNNHAAYYSTSVLYRVHAGAIWFHSEGSMYIYDSQFLNNNATGTGGAIAAGGDTGTIEVYRTLFKENTARDGGGAYYVEGGGGATGTTVKFYEVSFVDNNVRYPMLPGQIVGWYNADDSRNPPPDGWGFDIQFESNYQVILVNTITANPIGPLSYKYGSYLWGKIIKIQIGQVTKLFINALITHVLKHHLQVIALILEIQHMGREEL